jgi:hypothetical protein
MEVTKKSFSFPKKHDMPLYFVSAADGTNVVRLFRDSIRLANAYRSGDTADFIDQILRELEVSLQYNKRDDLFFSVNLPLVNFFRYDICVTYIRELRWDIKFELVPISYMFRINEHMMIVQILYFIHLY